jgi:amino acid permease
MDLQNANDEIKEEDNFLTEDDTLNPKYERGDTSFMGGFIQIGNTILGAGIISLPVVIRYLGFILGILFIIIIAILTVYSCYLLLKAHQITRKKKYSTIAHAAMGGKGYIFTNIMIILNNFGLSCVYFRIVGDTIQNIVGGYVSKDSFLVTNWHNFLYILIILIIMCFIIWTEDFKKFEKTSFLGMVGIIVYCVTILILFVYKLIEGFKPFYSKDSYFIDEEFTNTLISLPSVFLSFSFQFNLFPIYSGLRERTHHEMLNVTEATIIFCLILYLVTGIIGFLMYGNSLNDTILLAFLADMQNKETTQFMKILLIIINIGFLACSSTSIPLVYYTLKQNFFSTYKYIVKKRGKSGKNIEMEKEENNPQNSINHINPTNEGEDADNSSVEENSENNENNENKENKKEDANNDNDVVRMDSMASADNTMDDAAKRIKVNVSKKEEIIISIILYITVGVVTILVPELKSLFNIVGCTAANAIQFIIPSLMIVCLGKKAEKLVNLFFAKVLLIFGIVSLILSLTAEIMHIFL